jgi:hypothetical protein
MAEPLSSTAKKPYVTPHLRDYGDVRGLTATTTNFNNPTDGGSLANQYAS